MQSQERDTCGQCWSIDVTLVLAQLVQPSVNKITAADCLMLFFWAILNDFINDGITDVRNVVDFLLLELQFSSNK